AVRARPGSDHQQRTGSNRRPARWCSTDHSPRDGRGAQELLESTHEPTSGVDVELWRKPQHLLPDAQVNRAVAGMLAHEIADLAHEGVGQPVERQHDLYGGIATGRGELETSQIPADELRLVLTQIEPATHRDDRVLLQQAAVLEHRL